VQFNKVAIVGMGLLGGSLGRALRGGRVASCVAGYARRQATVNECRTIEAVDLASIDLGEVVRDAELVVLCTPIGQMAPMARMCLPHLCPGAVVTDVGSAKAMVVRELEPLFESAAASFDSDAAGTTIARINQAVNELCPGLIWQLRNSAAHYTGGPSVAG
jgi:prephenate dehydrogenase